VDFEVVVAAVADLTTRLLVRGNEWREPPTRRDLRQNAEAGWEDVAVQPGEANAGTGVVHRGEKLSDTTVQTTSTGGAETIRFAAEICPSIGLEETSKQIKGGKAPAGADGLIISVLCLWEAVDAGRPSNLTANRTERDPLVMSERFVVPDVLR